MLIEREYLVDWTGHGVPPPGYGLGGISGAPLLVPEFGPDGWYFRLGGVISESPGPRAPEDVIFEMVAADRAEFIHTDGTLAQGALASARSPCRARSGSPPLEGGQRTDQEAVARLTGSWVETPTQVAFAEFIMRRPSRLVRSAKSNQGPCVSRSVSSTKSIAPTESHPP